jgi:hypothetical protein
MGPDPQEIVAELSSTSSDRRRPAGRRDGSNRYAGGGPGGLGGDRAEEHHGGPTGVGAEIASGLRGWPSAVLKVEASKFTESGVRGRRKDDDHDLAEIAILVRGEERKGSGATAAAKRLLDLLLPPVPVGKQSPLPEGTSGEPRRAGCGRC